MSLKRVSSIASILILLFVCQNVQTQSLWPLEVDAEDSSLIGADLSVSHLKEVIRTQSWLRYDPAAKLMAINYGQKERSFLLDTLRLSAPTNGRSHDFMNYYDFQLIRGYFGEAGAISGLDTVAQFSPDKLLRLKAIYYLTVAGQYNRLDVLSNLTLERDRRLWYLPSFLGIYAQQPSQTYAARLVLQQMATDSLQPFSLYSGAVEELYAIDPILTDSLLMDQFVRATANRRKDLFSIGKGITQLKMTLYGVPRDTSSTWRGLYFPPYDFIKGYGVTPSFYTKEYLKPVYVKFCKDWLEQETDSGVRYRIREFLKDFLPLPPPDSVSLNSLFDSLLIQVGTLNSYNWIGNAAFTSTLESLLVNARSSLFQGDSNACARKAGEFQDLVDGEYKDSLDGDNNFVTIEAWKFLHYNAQYILDQLPRSETEK